jgi:polyphenol oxidase
MSVLNNSSVLRPAWSLPANVHAFVTTREGGVSQHDCASFNLAEHVKDDAHAVAANRALLLSHLQQATSCNALSIQWLQQVHGTVVHRVDSHAIPAPVADAAYSEQAGIACAVLTADCLPVLFTAADGSAVAVAHAGWRGLCNGVLEATVQQFHCDVSQIRAWLGPAIAPCHFEVGDEVRAAFLAKASALQQQATAAAFVSGQQVGKWQADLYALARLRLQTVGVTDVSGEARCTVCQHERFYSYRHAPQTGRFATVIVKAH